MEGRIGERDKISKELDSQGLVFKELETEGDV